MVFSMLSQGQVSQFEQEGYCVVPGLLSAADVSAFLAGVDEISAGATVASHDSSRLEMEPNQPPDGNKIRRIYEPCTYYPAFRALSESDRLLSALAQLIGPNLLFHYSKLNMNPPSIGSVVEWHQDLAYYPLTNTDSLAVLFYLDDSDRGNGCLQVIPRRHRDGIMNHTSGGFFAGRITEPVPAKNAISIEGQAGTAIFLHGVTPHASAPNSSPRPRRTLILGYRAADAYPVYYGETTVRSERHVRLVRGERCSRARFSSHDIPIPNYQDTPKSLYELQERFREPRA
jgi:phytanoyl-CoA hydroxylase